MTEPLLIGSDNAGFALKQALVQFLDARDVPYEDVGVSTQDDDRMYPLVAERVAAEIERSGFTRKGILLCGTGIGMAIAANKFKGIYAATCHDTFSAERATLSNNVNVLTMGARVIGPELAKKIVVEWLSHEFVPSSSSPKVEAIQRLEEENFKQNLSGMRK